MREFPNINVLKCKDEDYCKSEEEIASFLYEVVLLFIVNSDVYHTENYDDPIEKKNSVFEISLESGIAKNTDLLISQKTLESDHSFYSLGLR